MSPVVPFAGPTLEDALSWGGLYNAGSTSIIGVYTSGCRRVARRIATIEQGAKLI
jgi:hypothetical protein